MQALRVLSRPGCCENCLGLQCQQTATKQAGFTPHPHILPPFPPHFTDLPTFTFMFWFSFFPFPSRVSPFRPLFETAQSPPHLSSQPPQPYFLCLQPSVLPSSPSAAPAVIAHSNSKPLLHARAAQHPGSAAWQDLGGAQQLQGCS